MIGPPTAPPNVFLMRVGRGTPLLLLKKVLAVKIVFLWDSNNAACHWFVPLLVISDIWAPAERPCVALGLAVTTRNSSTASAFNRSTGALMSLVCASLISTPSRVIFDYSLRAPLTFPARVPPDCRFSH